ncbi:Rv3654c family TadE-like protein [Microlunatus elymi]|nr:Rv3654c family TadE-like protein [Microlunatus elymi]
MIKVVGAAGRDDRGSGTIMLMSVVIFMMLIASGFSVVGSYIVASHKARAAVDLAALAGAAAFGSGQDGCTSAETYATKNDHRVTDCSVVGDPSDFLLTVRVAVPAPIKLPGLPDEVTAEANAGPVR